MNELTTTRGGFIAPVADVKTALLRYQEVKDFIGQVLKPGVDFGAIPGAGDKPVLLKPGAEKMCSFFGLTPRIVESERVEDWTGKDHDGEPFFYYRYRIGLYRGDFMVAEGEGSANSWEKKYRYRNSERVCPSCGKSTIIKGKQEYGGGFLCYAKKGGCGAKFGDNDPAITGQEVGQVKNPDVADVVNTLQKMAQKRALIAPVLIATNTSDYFTQDIEDFIDPSVYAAAQAEKAQAVEGEIINHEAAERMAKGREMYAAMVARAEAAGMTPDEISEDWTLEDLRFAYAELKQFVEQAEAQAAEE